jgi:hypothetical protein
VQSAFIYRGIETEGTLRRFDILLSTLRDCFAWYGWGWQASSSVVHHVTVDLEASICDISQRNSQQPTTQDYHVEATHAMPPHAATCRHMPTTQRRSICDAVPGLLQIRGSKTSASSLPLLSLAAFIAAMLVPPRASHVVSSISAGAHEDPPPLAD